MSRRILRCLLLALPAIPAPSEAQDRVHVEVGAGLAVPTRDLADASLQMGVGFGGMIAYRVLPHLGAYAGWDWHQFSADQSFAGADADVESTGYRFGLHFQHPIGNRAGRLAVRVQAGGLYGHIEVEGPDGNLVVDTGHGLGWEAGAGLVVAVGSWDIGPAARYRSLKHDFVIGAATTSGTLGYAVIELRAGRPF